MDLYCSRFQSLWSHSDLLIGGFVGGWPNSKLLWQTQSQMSHNLAVKISKATMMFNDSLCANIRCQTNLIWLSKFYLRSVNWLNMKPATAELLLKILKQTFFLINFSKFINIFLKLQNFKPVVRFDSWLRLEQHIQI